MALPKFGRHSVGGRAPGLRPLGKVASCQVGASISAATDDASCPLSWPLFLPAEWDDDAERRADTYGLTMSDGYVSGQQRLQGGNVQIHKN
jgi:SRSO17 transposase